MKIRYGKIIKDFLLTIAFTGVVVVAATSPYFWISVARSVAKSKKYSKGNVNTNNVNETSLARSLSGLNKNKVVILKREGDKFTIRLTEKGKRIIEKLQFEDMVIEKPKIWDKKWRIVIFDIPEKKGRRVRDAMRCKLQNLGFYQFQKSVWAYPYPCEKEIRLLCEIIGANPFVNIITTDEIYNDNSLRKKFGL